MVCGHTAHPVRPFSSWAAADNRVSSYVSAEGASMCTIILDGTELVDFRSEADPTCDFAYWG